MKEQVTRKIYNRFWECMNHTSLISEDGWNPYLVIGHPAKRKVIKEIITNGKTWFEEFQKSTDRLAYLQSLPWLGGEALGFHLARNMGIDCVKPDVHLKRLAERWGFKTPLLMCQEIQKITKMKLGVIDLILWRYCNLTGDYGSGKKEEKPDHV